MCFGLNVDQTTRNPRKSESTPRRAAQDEDEDEQIDEEFKPDPEDIKWIRRFF
jgi:hypothetical protein